MCFKNSGLKIERADGTDVPFFPPQETGILQISRSDSLVSECG